MAKRRKRKKNLNKLLSLIFCFLLGYFIYYVHEEYVTLIEENEVKESYANFDSIPEYNGEAYVYINNNIPTFTDEEKTLESLEYYSPLDNLGRCGVAFANVSKDTMPTEERESISNIEPTGWQSVKYAIVSGGYLYNRCHLIGYQLTGENANAENLITCTRYMNATTMLQFEQEVAAYVEETGNHVLYKVTPYFEGDNLVATGVSIEAYSIEDNGEGISFNVFVYNVEPGITIDYATGESKLEG